MTGELHLRTGFEVELMAPRGVSRRTLALDLAGRATGRVRPVWHQDSEPSLVPGLDQFLHLSQGFEVRNAADDVVATLVDDVTLLADPDPRHGPVDGWFRVLTDDPRILALLARATDPGGTAQGVLQQAAALWDVPVEQHGDVFRISTARGDTIALAAPQGGERERPCEIVTPPLARDHALALEALLRPARDLGFTVPAEAAVHLHLDGAPFRHAPALSNVVRLFAHWRPGLRTLLETNPACRRLAPLPAGLVAAADAGSSFGDLARAADEGGLNKFFDVNLTQLFADRPIRDTIEVRILPGSIDTEEIIDRARLIEGLLQRCLDPMPLPLPPSDPAAALPALLELARRSD